MYLIVLFVLILAIAAITSGIIVSYNNFQGFQEQINHRTSSLSTQLMPIITADGEVIDTAEQLDTHLQLLNEKLQEKVTVLTTSKSKYLTTQEKINRLNLTKNEIKKFYLRLKNEIGRTESECRELQEQINDYLQRRDKIKKELLTASVLNNALPKNVDLKDDPVYEDVQNWIADYKRKYGLGNDAETLGNEHNDDNIRRAIDTDPTILDFVRTTKRVNEEYGGNKGNKTGDLSTVANLITYPGEGTLSDEIYDDTSRIN